MPINNGQQYTFDYPAQFTSLPDYSAHRGQIVTVVRPLVAPYEFDGDPEMEPMYRIQATDGWTGDAYESELLTENQKQMQSWTDEKLDRELAFAEGSEGDDPNAAQWLLNIKAEIASRRR